jgi:hypothetical protein
MVFLHILSCQAVISMGLPKGFECLLLISSASKVRERHNIVGAGVVVTVLGRGEA